MKRSTWTKAAVAMGMTLASAMVLAQPASGPGTGPGPGPGAGMMRGYGGGPGRGDCDGYGGGPGMMGGYGGGPGMMGGYGGGAGMMYGQGGGPGARGGGPGMMGGWGGGPGWGRGPGSGLAQLGLSADQEEKIAAIREDMRRKTWDTRGQMHSEQFKLRNLYMADTPDPNAIADQQKKIDDLRLTMIKARVEAGNQMRAVLTKEQRERLREFAPWWMEQGGDD